jgi:hypothetical protein
MQTIQLPELHEGEKYAGFTLDENGNAKEHVVLLPGDAGDVTWDQAMAWAQEQGGELPTRQEQSLLFANLKSQFEPTWYWSNTQYSPYHAYGQRFDDGYTYYLSKHYKCRARLVRRLPI